MTVGSQGTPRAARAPELSSEKESRTGRQPRAAALEERFFTHVSPTFEGAGFGALFSAEQALAARAGIGGTAPDAVAEQIASLRTLL